MSGGKVAPDALEVEAFIARWRMSEGAERASFPLPGRMPPAVRQRLCGTGGCQPSSSSSLCDFSA